MANPTPFTRNYGFGAFQQNDPTSPLPGDAVDAQLDNVATSTQEIVSALADVRRADGQLKNGVVTLDALSPGFAEAFRIENNGAVNAAIAALNQALADAVTGASADTASARADAAAAVALRVLTSSVGAANGVAPLDGSAKVPAVNLPSFVDDAVEYDTLADAPAVGEKGKIYVITDTNQTYRWSGSAYAEISASPGSTDSVAEGSTNLYFTPERALSAALSGFTPAAATAVSPADTVFSALRKAQGQVDALGSALSGKAPLASPDFTGDVLVPNPAANDSSRRAANTSWVLTKIAAATSGVSTVNGHTGAVTLTPADIGLGNAENTADADKPVSTAVATALAGKLDTSTLGAANGVAPLDGGGKVAAAFLPSFVDDVMEYADVVAFPAVGESGKIYVALGTNQTYRWSGSAYAEISASPGSTDAVPEGFSNLYFTQVRARSVPLTGLDAGAAGTVAATDSVIVAFSKIVASLASLKTAAFKDAGSGAGQVVLLDGAGKLPAVDGSNLTGINAGLSRAEACALALVL